MEWIIAIGVGIILIHELFRNVLDRAAWKSSRSPKIRAKSIFIRFFTILTFPLVVLIYLAAAIWLLPYLLLSKPYRQHMKQEAEAAKSAHEKNLDWQAEEFSGQLSSLAVPAFLTLPFKPIYAFMEFLGKRNTTPWESKEKLQSSSSPVESQSATK